LSKFRYHIMANGFCRCHWEKLIVFKMRSAYIAFLYELIMKRSTSFANAAKTWVCNCVIYKISVVEFKHYFLQKKFKVPNRVLFEVDINSDVNIHFTCLQYTAISVHRKHFIFQIWISTNFFHVLHYILWKSTVISFLLKLCST